MYGSGILHAWVKKADGTVHDLDAIMSADDDPTMESTEIPGDDEIKVTFNSNQKLGLSIKANAHSFGAIDALSGNTTTFVAATTGVGAQPAYKHTAGGTNSEKNPPFVEMGTVTNGKDNLGNEGHIIRVFHKLQAMPAKSPQENASEYGTEFDATAYPTATDIEGNALASKRIYTKYFIDGPYDPANTIV